IMLADTVEAAVRSMPDPTPKAIEEFIARLVRSKLDDGQLNNAPLTLRNITKICETFSTVLNGVFHERIEYPSISPSAAAHVAALTQAEESPVEAQELHRVTDENPERAAEQLVEEVAAQAEHASDEMPADSGEAAEEQAMLDARKLAQAPADANEAEESRKSDAEKPEAQDDH
ncbi:MAG: hypothetical protein RSH26_06565, partial [Clostridia bacterium]